jgi:hypothetical protein
MLLLATPRFCDDVFTDQQTKLDSDSGETNAVAARLRTGGQIMVPHQIAPPHARSIIHDGQGR